MRRQQLEPTHRSLEPPHRGRGGTVTIVATSTTTKTTSGRGATTTADTTSPLVQTRTKIACHHHQTGFCRSNLRNKKRAGGIPPPPFMGPDDNDQSRQRTGDGKKKSRRWTKKHEDWSGQSTMAVGCGKSGRWTVRRATKEGGGRRRMQ